MSPKINITDKGRTKDFVCMVYSHPDYGAYVEIWWRRKDMLVPAIECNGFDTAMNPEKLEVMIAFMTAASEQYKQWVAKPPWR